MGALSFRLPDTKHQRLKKLAEFDLKTKFEILASRGRGNEQRGLELLEKAKG